MTNIQTAPGQTLGNVLLPNNDYSTVRDHWLNKFPSDTKKPISSNTPSSTLGSSNNLKRISNDVSNHTPPKVPKICIQNDVECPICSQKMPSNELNNHLDDCLNTTKPCIVCDRNIPVCQYYEHVSECCNRNFKSDIPDDKDVKPKIIFQICSVCDKPIDSNMYNVHLQRCLEKIYEEIENAYIKNTANCPVCETEVPENELNDHLETCRDISLIFEDEGNVPTEADSKKNMHSLLKV